MKRSAFTLIETVFSISLLLLLSISLINISAYTINSVRINNTKILLEQSADFLQEYFKKELSADKISLIDYNKDDYFIKYQTFYKDENSSYKYILSDKKLRIIKDSSVMIIDTHNNTYIKNNQVFQKISTNKEISNVVEENIKSVNLSMHDDKLYFDIILEKDGIKLKLNFYIKGLKQRNFI